MNAQVSFLVSGTHLAPRPPPPGAAGRCAAAGWRQTSTAPPRHGLNSPTNDEKDGELSLVHIPLELYSQLLQPILRVLLPQRESLRAGDRATAGGRLTPDHRHGFLNVSVTPVECSVVCHDSWVRNVFDPAIRRLPRDAARAVSVSRDSYVALSVISAGMDAGSRVVDLSSPLALAGIPIFFITTYYSDFILVPAKDRERVVRALLARGFDFCNDSDSSFVAPNPRGGMAHSRGGSGSGSSRSGSSSDHPAPTGLLASPTSGGPPPSNAVELQARTFDMLKKRRVEPRVDPELHLIHCSGRKTTHRQLLGGEINAASAGLHRPSLSRINTGTNGSGGPVGGGGGGGGGDRWGGGGGGWGDGGGDDGEGGEWGQTTWADTVDARFYACLVSALAAQPRFLSVTLAQDDPPSLLLDKTLLPLFGESVIGDTEGDLVPIFLDLAALPFEATGIVSGVAGRLVQEMQSEAPELSYLSTARAGAVILSHDQSVKAVEILRPLLVKE